MSTEEEKASTPDDPAPFALNWSDVNSDYSTDFTGYSNCSETLSDLREDELATPLSPPEKSKAASQKVAADSFLRGRFIRVQTQTSPPSGEFVVTIELQRGQKQKKDVITINARPGEDVNSQIDFGKVKKGWNVKITVAEPEKPPLASVFQKVREIELDGPRQVELSFKQEDETIGEVVIEFDRTLSL
jgi:hypothetical protein